MGGYSALVVGRKTTRHLRQGYNYYMYTAVSWSRWEEVTASKKRLDNERLDSMYITHHFVLVQVFLSGL